MAPETPGRPGALRSLLLYALLVGVPVLGLVAVVRAGEALRAPVSVGGAWLVESVDGAGAGECSALAPGEALAVSQSGVYVTLVFGRGTGGMAVATQLRGDSLTGTLPATPACRGLADGWVAVTVDRATAPHRMRGSIRPADPDADVVGFTAARLPAPTRRGGEGH